MKRHILGLLALLAGVSALGLAIIPGVALERSPPPLAGNQKRPSPSRVESEKSGVTLRTKKWSLTLGRGEKDGATEAKPDAGEPEATKANVVASQGAPDQLLKWLTVSAVSCSLIGLLLGPISWFREKQPALAGAAVAISCAAILWQHIAAGVVIGVAMAICLVVVSVIAK